MRIVNALLMGLGVLVAIWLGAVAGAYICQAIQFPSSADSNLANVINLFVGLAIGGGIAYAACYLGYQSWQNRAKTASGDQDKPGDSTPS